MSSNQSSSQRRLSQVKDFLTLNKRPTSIPWDPDCTIFPTRKELPQINGAPDGAAWVWGADDWLGRINLLTPTRVRAAAVEIKLGEIVPLNLPLNVPEVPGFAREPFEHKIKELFENLVFDDTYTLNTQSGSQWDGFRHFAHMPSAQFYNGAKAEDIIGPKANEKCSVHHLSEHGFAGRGILIDYRSYANRKGIHYDPYTRYEISWDELYTCGKDQGIDIRPQAVGGDIKIGDFLFIRSGFTEAYNSKTAEERAVGARRPHVRGPENEQRWAGISNDEKMVDWLHDCYFAAVAGDAPSFEAWPALEGLHLHEHLLGLWGCPIGELLNLEKLSQRCRELNRWTFFITSSPANCPGGVASHVNGMAIL